MCVIVSAFIYMWEKIPSKLDERDYLNSKATFKNFKQAP